MMSLDNCVDIFHIAPGLSLCKFCQYSILVLLLTIFMAEIHYALITRAANPLHHSSTSVALGKCSAVSRYMLKSGMQKHNVH